MNTNTEYLKSQGLSDNFPDRFIRKVLKTKSGCWLWTASVTKDGGYGQISKNGKMSGPITAHRASWILYRGPIPDGMHVLHNCPDGDNPKCCNPSHLYIGMPIDNHRDMTTRGKCIGDNSLRWQEVLEIRSLYETGKYSYRSLAKKYKSCHQMISHIINRRFRRFA